MARTKDPCRRVDDRERRCRVRRRLCHRSARRRYAGWDSGWRRAGRLRHRSCIRWEQRSPHRSSNVTRVFSRNVGRNTPSERRTSPVTVLIHLPKRQSAPRLADPYMHGSVLLGYLDVGLATCPADPRTRPQLTPAAWSGRSATLPSGLAGVQPGRRAAVSITALIAYSGGHSGGHSTRPTAPEPDRTHQNPRLT
jgi:hypothetical protein